MVEKTIHYISQEMGGGGSFVEYDTFNTAGMFSVYLVCTSSTRTSTFLNLLLFQTRWKRALIHTLEDVGSPALHTDFSCCFLCSFRMTQACVYRFFFPTLILFVLSYCMSYFDFIELKSWHKALTFVLKHGSSADTPLASALPFCQLCFSLLLSGILWKN